MAKPSDLRLKNFRVFASALKQLVYDFVNVNLLDFVLHGIDVFKIIEFFNSKAIPNILFKSD